MELWDLIDQTGIPLGMVHERGKPIPKGAYHLVVHICVFNDKDELLIQKRTPDRSAWPDQWDVSAAGSVLTQETSRQAAERELKEEIGLDYCFQDEQAYLTVHGKDWISDWYLIECNCDLQTLNLQKEEVAEIKWATLESISMMKKEGQFIPYHDGFLELLFQMRKKRGAIQ
ncbi:MAG: NUDIX domain-containing protein [Erysipelotrichaceae bacterium]|nr:NUDIX domain-containing protein [Erysipelotrichaceae bacterium]